MTDAKGRTDDRPGADAEAFYEALVEAHEGLTLEQCVRMDARLILILAGRIGDAEWLRAALATARQGAR